MTIPCITMSGTRPTFYLVPVTTELNDAVITGQYPATQTRILRCATVLTPRQYWNGGCGVQKACPETLPRFQGTGRNSLEAYSGGGLGDTLSHSVLVTHILGTKINKYFYK